MLTSSFTQQTERLLACSACNEFPIHSSFQYRRDNPCSLIPTDCCYTCPNCTYAAAVKGVNCKYFGLTGNELNTTTVYSVNSQLSVQQESVPMQCVSVCEYPELPKRHNSYFEGTEIDEYGELMDTTQYSRRMNLEITGVPVTRNENLYKILFLIATAIGVPLRMEMISSARRLEMPIWANGRGKPRMYPHIIVAFVNRKTKTAWRNASKGKKLMASDLMDGFPFTRIYLNDHLTWGNKVILGRARRHVRQGHLDFAWTSDCKVLVKKAPLGPSIRVHSIDDVDYIARNELPHLSN